MACRCYIKVINNCQALDRGMLALGMSKDLKEGVLFMCEDPTLASRATARIAASGMRLGCQVRLSAYASKQAGR